MNLARAIDVELSGRSRVWQGRGEARGDGRTQIGARPISSIVGRIGPRQNNGSWGVNGPGPNDKKDGGEKSNNRPRDRGTHHLSYQDLLDRKQKGLCFKCGGSYGPLHQCPVKQLRVVMLNEEIQVECDDIEEEHEDDDALEAGEIEGACTTLSLCSMATGGDA